MKGAIQVRFTFTFSLLMSYARSHYVVSRWRPPASSASYRCSSPPLNLVNGQELTICNIVWVSPVTEFIVSETWFIAAHIAVVVTRAKTIHSADTVPCVLVELCADRSLAHSGCMLTGWSKRQSARSVTMWLCRAQLMWLLSRSWHQSQDHWYW